MTISAFRRVKALLAPTAGKKDRLALCGHVGIV
jgi:hypothetical protein